MSATDTQLVARLRSGERAAFDEVYAGYQQRIYGFLLRLSGRREVADDLFQETWMRLARHAPTLREDTDLAAWLFTVARNLYRSHQRFAIFDRLRGRDVTTMELAAGASPEQETAGRRAVQALERALALVGAAHREILLLVGVEGLEPSQAAQVLGVSAETARQRLLRARVELGKHMGDER